MVRLLVWRISQKEFEKFFHGLFWPYLVSVAGHCPDCWVHCSIDDFQGRNLYSVFQNDLQISSEVVRATNGSEINCIWVVAVPETGRVHCQQIFVIGIFFMYLIGIC